MKHKVILEIDGVRHKLINGKETSNPCSKCSLEHMCCNNEVLKYTVLCLRNVPGSRYRKCKPGE
jgi:hypothetical protein